MALLATLALLAAWQGIVGAGAAAARPMPAHRGDATATPLRSIRFAGRVVRAPASWPVYRLAAHPSICVRLDRRAVYLGRPGANQRCPAMAIGRRRAILVEPRTAPGAAARVAGAAGGASGGQARASSTSGGPGGASATQASSEPEFTGLGFDACSAPSSRAMAAWDASPYRAIGVYIGGANRACSQPNLSPAWVHEQVVAGWHLMPLYVGLQAPTSSCSSCAKFGGAGAASQGAAAARDAAEEASAVDIGPGSPVYFDLEAYGRTSSATQATLTFLAAWTSQLHALGYRSGVYSSSNSGIVDLASQLETGYQEPDDLWIANWNGQRSTADPAVPPQAWSQHERLHQYAGGHNETYGGVTINIDNDYVEGATVGAAAESLGVKGSLEGIGSPRAGRVRIVGWAFDQSEPSATLAIRAYVGGRAGRSGVLAYEAGSAGAPRPDIAESHTSAGEDHGFDLTFATIRSGRQPICVYAVSAAGVEQLLGCRTVNVKVALSLSHVSASSSAVRLAVRCEWVSATECPGQILLRARVRVPARRGRTRLVRMPLGRLRFVLGGETSQTFRLALSGRGRRLTRGGRLAAELVVAIPGSKVMTTVIL